MPMYSNFMFLDRLLFELLCKTTHIHSNKYSIVFATITIIKDLNSKPSAGHDDISSVI